jgi:hypothetical protein
MPKRPKAGDPELLLVSFCDIVTVTTAALFMAMVITIQEAMKVPVLKSTPRAKSTVVRKAISSVTSASGDKEAGVASFQKTPVYFECRNSMMFPVNYEELYQQTKAARTGAAKKTDEAANKAGSTSTEKSQFAFLNNMQNQEIGNDYYRVQPSFLMLGQMVLEPRIDAKGETEDEVNNKNKSKFFAALHKVDKNKQYVVFLVRDDSFPLFKTCRRFVQQEGYDSGWEYLDDDQLIKFGGFGGALVPPQ